jgi:hypothetical protein
MVPAACAAAMYFASTAGVDAWSIQYACGVFAMAVNSGLGGLALFAARMAAELGLT